MIDKKFIAGPWITELEIEYINRCMESGWNNYEFVEKFEQGFAEYHGRKFGIMTQSCTSTIHLILTALGVGRGDEVIVTDLTWIATALPISYLGATPIFCDVDNRNWCLDPNAVLKSITDKTKTVIAVDLHGNMPEMDILSSLCEQRGIPLIEDAAQGVGSVYYGKKAGSYGIASCFSFHRTKTLTTGEGGMLLLDDEDLYKHCRMMWDLGRKEGDPQYFNRAKGYKYTPSNLSASLGCAQFQRIDELVGKKQYILHRYKENLGDIDWLWFNYETKDIINGAWTTACVLPTWYNPDKLQFIKKMAELDIPIRPGFYALSGLPAFYNGTFEYLSKNPNAYNLASRIVNLPSALTITDEIIDEVSEGIRKVLK